MSATSADDIETDEINSSGLPGRIALIDGRALDRECMIRSIRALCPDSKVAGYDTPEAWLARRTTTDDEVVLYNLGSDTISSDEVKEAMRDFVDQAAPARVIVLAQADDLSSILDAMDVGASSYMPPSVGLADLIEAMRMSSSTGVFVQRKNIMALRGLVRTSSQRASGLESQFTERQLAVARALQRGLPNKTIAYELNLCESTVKVHIRNIMKKLNATNRTQAAFRLNALIDGPH